MTAQAGDTTSSFARRKAAVRLPARALRQGLPRALRRRAAEQAARHLAPALRGRRVAVYLSLGEEIDTAPLIRRLRQLGCALYVPKVGARGQLRFTRLVAGAALRPNRYGIREPAVLRRPARLDAIVMPLVAFDAAGRRLGMGGGYYDRVLGTAPPYRRPWRVGFAFAAQQVARVPTDAHDARLHAVATEHGLRRFAGPP
jgi:5-formyltetrahydrofolate cyclo-ligase